MNNLVIPPSPSWYLSNIIACNDVGVIAYGARHEIIIVKQKPDAESSPYNLEYSFIPAAHKDRITCIAFSPNNASESFRNCLVSASDDGSVRLWDFETLELKLINSGPKEPQKIAAVDWSSSDPNVVISVSELRVLYCWDLLSNRLRKLNLGPKVVPVSLSICPHDKQIVAVGAKAGLILIVSLKGEGGVKFRMRSHDSDVISLSWCPVKYNVFRATKEKLESGNNDYELLLASGGKDRTIYFWRVGTDGRYETFINLPAQPYVTGYRSKMVGDKGTVSIWGCVQWIDPFTLLSGSQFGELLSWDLHPTNKPGQAIKSGKLLHGRHSKGVFSISCQATTSKNSEDNRVVWTTAVDRKLIAYSLKTGKILTELTTIGGIVYCMAISPLDPNRIAVGVGDGKILIWNMSCSDQLDIKVFWQKINSKVMAMEWHPTEENWLAFGTGEGRVGIIDVGTNKPPIIFRQHHHRSVYRVLWAPHVKEKNLNHSGKYELALFSVGDGEILQHSVKTPEKEPVKLNDILAKADVLSGLDKSGRTDFLTNHDRSLIAVGNENGVVYILDTKTYEKQSTLLAHKKIVQCLTWHPASVTSDPSRLSPCLNWLAVASDTVKVFSIGLDGKTFETVAALTIHTEKVVDLAWSPHLNGHLVSSSYDYTAQVWDVTTHTPIANFNKHHNAVLCSLWSPLKPEYIITGSSDNTVRVWKVSEQPNKRCTESKKLRLNNVTKRIENAPEAVEIAPDRNSLRVEANAMANQVKKSSNKVIEPRIAELDPVKEWNAGQEKRTKGKSLFPVTSAALSVSKHFEVYFQQWKSKQNTESVATENAIVNGDSSTDEPTDSGVQNKENLNELAYLDFFGDGNAMRKLMKTEETHLLQENRMIVAQQCTLWRGDITEIIREAMNKKQLNDWLMTLAPMASLRLWQEACVIYSEQLANQGDFMKAASYLLGVHKVEEAVQLLSDHKYHREAVALAKCRLPDDDPIVQNAMRLYAETAQSDGMLNLAAHCFLSLGDPLAAGQALARGKDLKSLKLAALLANEANAVEVADALAKEALCSGLMAGDFESCSEILEHHRNLEFLNIWINTNKMLNENKRLEFSSSLNWLQGRANDTNSVLNKIKEEVKKVGDCYDKLKANVNCFITLDTEKQLWLFISSHLSLSGAASTYSITLHHIVQALAAAYRFQINSDKNDILIRVCMLLSPKGPLTEDSIFVRESESDEEKFLISSMHSFLLAGIVSWLNENLKDGEDENRDILKQFLSTSNDNQDDKFAWLTSIIDACQADLFNFRNIEYFKNETLIKNLELKIASSRCNLTNEKGEHRVMLTAVRNKNKRAKKQIKSATENYNKTDDSLNSNEKSNSDEKVKEDNVSNNQSDKKDAAVTCDAVKTVMTIDKTAVIISEDKPSEELVNVNTGDIIHNDSSNSQEVVGSEDNVNNVNSLNVLQSSMVNVDSVNEVSTSENRQLSSNQSENENKVIEVVKDNLIDSTKVSEVSGAIEISTPQDNKITKLNKMENGSKSLDVEKVDSTKISGINNNESSDSNQVENKSVQLEDKIVEDEKLPIDSNLSLDICNKTESNNSNQLENVNKCVETTEKTLEDSKDKKICLSNHTENVKNLVSETEGSKTDSDNLIKDKNCNSSNKNILPKGIELESSNVSIQIVNKIDKKFPSNSSIVIEFNNNSSDDSKYLQRLNASKLKFESEKVSTPNPFYTYCQLQKVMVSLLKHENPVLYELLKNKIEESWKSANAN